MCGQEVTSANIGDFLVVQVLSVESVYASLYPQEDFRVFYSPYVSIPSFVHVLYFYRGSIFEFSIYLLTFLRKIRPSYVITGVTYQRLEMVPILRTEWTHAQTIQTPRERIVASHLPRFCLVTDEEFHRRANREYNTYHV